MSVHVCLFAILVLLSGCPAGIWAARRPEGSALIYSVCAASAAVMAGTALGVLFRPGETAGAVLPMGVPWLQAHFAIDALSAFFLLVINLGALAASIYGMGTDRSEPEAGRILPFYPLFLAGMNLVLLAADAFTFLLSWESMSLASWALVMAHHRESATQRAGFVYIVMAALGTLALLLAFGLMAGADGNYAFAQLREAAPAAGLGGVVLLLVLIGAGSKAGLAPLHVWLPLAHPAAPSHVSALMSGVMTKIAVYALLRILLDLLGGVQWWWGALLMTLGALTAVMGVLHALMESDLKRLLAYSTVENVGFIFIGIGLGMAFQANGMNAAAALAYSAALFHVLNHSWIKSLLFLGAGAVLHATHERRLDALGGLIRRMPYTAFCFLVGSAAIASLPPLNAFASEWLTLQAILLSRDLPQWLLRFLVPAVGALMVLAAALAGAVFVKAFGIAFLGRPRSPQAEAAQETNRLAGVAMTMLVVLCVLAGIFTGPVLHVIQPAVAAIVEGPAAPGFGTADIAFVAPTGAGGGSYSGFFVFLFVATSAWGAALVIHRGASRATRRAPAWDCGFALNHPAFQYGAASMAQPLRRIFGTVVFRATETVEMPPPGSIEPARYRATERDPAWDLIFTPVAAAVAAIADRIDGLQFLSIRRYLAMMFAGLVALLTLVALWR